MQQMEAFDVELTPAVAGALDAASDDVRRRFFLVADHLARRPLELVNKGQATVTAAEIAERLRAEGDTTINQKDLATAVGNTLVRSSDWERVRTGEYRRITPVRVVAN